MKTYELTNLALKNRAEAQVTEKTVFDFYKEVKAGKIVPITDDQENIIGFNVVKPKPSTMKVCKVVDGKLTTGDTEEDRQEDEVALHTFLSEYPEEEIQQWFLDSMIIIKSGYTPDDVMYVNDDCVMLFADKKQCINLDGEVIVDLSNDDDLVGASDKIILKLLRASLNSEY